MGPIRQRPAVKKKHLLAPVRRQPLAPRHTDGITRNHNECYAICSMQLVRLMGFATGSDFPACPEVGEFLSTFSDSKIGSRRYISDELLKRIWKNNADFRKEKHGQHDCAEFLSLLLGSIDGDGSYGKKVGLKLKVDHFCTCCRRSKENSLREENSWKILEAAADGAAQKTVSELLNDGTSYSDISGRAVVNCETAGCDGSMVERRRLEFTAGNHWMLRVQEPKTPWGKRVTFLTLPIWESSPTSKWWLYSKLVAIECS
jgi:hypothetical protein